MLKPTDAPFDQVSTCFCTISRISPASTSWSAWYLELSLNTVLLWAVVLANVYFGLLPMLPASLARDASALLLSTAEP
jgi:hypothetical protein